MNHFKRNTLKNLSWLIFLALGFTYAFSTSLLQYKSSDRDVQNLNDIIEWTKTHLPQSGILQENKDGFVYLKVDDDYIHKLFPLLHRPNYEEPPYFRSKNSPGAHVSVFYTKETAKIGEIQEIGKKFEFEINHFKSVPPGSNDYLVLTIIAPELEALRKKYGFRSFINGHEFHITIAKKKYHH